jgi:hypothetical protein
MVRYYLCACSMSGNAHQILIRSDILFWFIYWYGPCFLDLACGFYMRRSMASSRAVVVQHCMREDDACVWTRAYLTILIEVSTLSEAHCTFCSVWPRQTTWTEHCNLSLHEAEVSISFVGSGPLYRKLEHNLKYGHHLPLKAQWLVHVPLNLTYQYIAFCPQNVFSCFSVVIQ